MVRLFFELLPCGRAFLEKKIHGYNIDQTAYISKGTKIIYHNKKTKGQLIMKKHAWVGMDCILDITKDLSIGNYAQIAPRTMIFTHDTSLSTENPIKKEVKIDDGAYIGAGSIVLPGVTIGKNAVIGAGAVVTKDIPGGMIAIGIPAKVIGSSSKN